VKAKCLQPLETTTESACHPSVVFYALTRTSTLKRLGTAWCGFVVTSGLRCTNVLQLASPLILVWLFTLGRVVSPVSHYHEQQSNEHPACVFF